MLLNVLPKINNYKYGIVFLSISAIFVSVMLKDINRNAVEMTLNYSDEELYKYCISKMDKTLKMISDN